MHVHVALALVLALHAPRAAPAIGQDAVVAPPAVAAEVRDALAEAVDAPTAEARRAAALELAARRDVPLGVWVEACRTLPPLADALPEGVSVHRPRLEVDGALVACALHVRRPRELSPGPAPLIVALHGAGGSGERAIGRHDAVADAAGAWVLAPTEPGENDGFRGDAAEREAVLAAIRWLRRRADIDEDAVFLEGYSRGGHLTWDLGARRPDRFAGLVTGKGAPRFELRGGQNNFRFLEGLARTPIWAIESPVDPSGLGWSLGEAIARLEAFGAEGARMLEARPSAMRGRGDAPGWLDLLDARREADPDRQVICVTSANAGRVGALEITRLGRGVEVEFDPVLPKKEYEAMSPEELRRWLIDEAIARTARAEARWTDDGALEVEAERTAELLVYVTAERAAVLEERVPARVNRRRARLRLRPDAEVLLTDFVERIDRRFLPVATLAIRPR